MFHRCAVAVPLDHRAGVHGRADRAGGGGDRAHRGAVEPLGPRLPPAVGEPAGRPELGQDDEVGALLLADQGAHAVDPLGDRLVVAVAELHQVDSHAASLGIGRHLHPSSADWSHLARHAARVAPDATSRGW